MNRVSKWSLVATSALLLSQMAMADTLDFKNASGIVLIAAPTALKGPTNQGVWFLNPNTKMFSLNLPKLPSNKVYEGWVVDDCTGKKVSTGLFRENGGIDSDAAGAFAGPLALNFPAQPGSDFVKLGQDLADGGHNVVITVEHYPDNDPNPSDIVILKANIPMDTTVGTILTLENVTE